MTTDQLPRWPLLDDYRVPGLLLLLGFGVLLLPAVVLLARRAAVIVLYTDGLIERRGQDLDAGTAPTSGPPAVNSSASSASRRSTKGGSMPPSAQRSSPVQRCHPVS